MEDQISITNLLLLFTILQYTDQRGRRARWREKGIGCVILGGSVYGEVVGHSWLKTDGNGPNLFLFPFLHFITGNGTGNGICGYSETDKYEQKDDGNRRKPGT